MAWTKYTLGGGKTGAYDPEVFSRETLRPGHYTAWPQITGRWNITGAVNAAGQSPVAMRGPLLGAIRKAPAQFSVTTAANTQLLTVTPLQVVPEVPVTALTAFQTVTLTQQPADAFELLNVTVTPQRLLARIGPQSCTVSGSATVTPPVNIQTIRHSISSATPYVPPPDTVANTGALVYTTLWTVRALTASAAITSSIPAGTAAVTVTPLSATAAGVTAFGVQTLSESIVSLPVVIGIGATAEAALIALFWRQREGNTPPPREPWFVVPAEARGFTVPAEARHFTVSDEPRGFIVLRDTRGFIVPKKPS